MKDFVWGRYALLFYAPIFAVVALGFSPFSESPFLFAFVGLACAGLSVLAVRDFSQKRHAVLANYPVFARFRYFFEEIRPELRQYFWETDDEELPYSRNQRAIVYQRAKGVMAARPFGSTQKMYEEDHTWLNHSVAPSTIKDTDFRYLVGEGEKAYLMSVLNISGTSFGALSPQRFNL